MTGDILDRVRTLFGAGPGENPREGGGREGQLFECRDCGTIYIRETARPCPECGHDVEPIPNEQDLGLG